MRTLGIALLAYGVAGMVLIGLALVIGGPSIGRAERLAGSVNQTVVAATDAAEAAATAFSGFDASLGDAEAATRDAAQLSRDASATLEAMAVTMSLSIFGAQPLLPLADDFQVSADQLGALGGDLDRIGSALVESRDDVAEVGIELQVLADELRQLSGELSRQLDTGSPPLTPLFYGFVAWQLMPALGAVAAGIWLLRGPALMVVVRER
jgi:hypothetical protein